MKTTKIVQSKFIQGADGFESSAEFNQAMMELAELNPTFEREGNSFWIFYYVTQTEPENIVEEHELNGENAHCADCPFIVRDLNRFGKVDGVKKHATCGLTGERVRIDSRVCEAYYTERG
jgi:hypothetical protein